MPHGYCYLWDPRIVWLNVISDSLITLSYYCIPIVLIYFIRKRRDLPFNWIFWMFGSFILACGTTHLMEVWNIWHASYLLSGIIKAITAAISVATAIRLIPLVPHAVTVPTLVTLFPRGLLHTSTVAHLMVSKFGLGVPHYRLERDLAVELQILGFVHFAHATPG